MTIERNMTPAQLSALRVWDRASWARYVKSTLKKHATVKDAAAELGVSWRTLMRWRAELEIRA